MERTKVALVYDFDGTLSPGNMQEYDFIPSVGKNNEQFWDYTNSIAREQDADPILVYMWRMIREAQSKELPIKREAFVHSGRNIKLFNGVKDWFARINSYGKDKGLDIEHYIISSGIKEMIEGTAIAGEFKQIYACSFLYDENDIACWPSVSVNYTNKTQFIFKINKGIDSVFESKLINKFTPEEERPVQFRHMIYFGDGTTDIPCMKLVKEKNGHSIAVYNPECGTSGLENLIKDNRVNYVCCADYSEEGEIDNLVRAIINKIQADLILKEFTEKNK
ncbi:MAG: haloacid dehalogenase-like hydrolase [Rikenellaceae bacterium]|nr:haloacid dehalogenase-like hydrolase [Rikenellaceae bacterium]